MHRRVMRSIVVACFWVVAAQPTLAETGQDSAAPNPQFVLEQIQKRLDAISNYRCIQVTPQRRSNQPVAAKSEKKHLAYDRHGRIRIREEYDNLDATTYIWDGARTIEVNELVKPNGTVIHSALILPGRYTADPWGRLPWNYLGGNMVTTLSKALEDGKDISIEPTEEGHCRLGIHVGSGAIMATVLDPKRGYLPIRTELIVQGERRRCEYIEFNEIESGVWFPTAIWTQYAHQRTGPSRNSVPRLRFTNTRVNDPNFDRLLAPDMPDGSTVADEVRGLRYVVDHKHGFTITSSVSSSLDAGQGAQADGLNRNTSPGAFATAYKLDANQTLKRIGPPFPWARREFTLNGEPHQAQVSDAALLNTIYVFHWDDGSRPKVAYAGTGFLTLSEVLQYVCGLGIAEYSGPEKLLNLRLKGDWIVRRDTSKDERLRSLERIAYEGTGKKIAFKKQRVDTPVVRATGIFQYQPSFGAAGENDVQLFAETHSDHYRSYAGGGSGRLGQLLRHMADRTGRRFVDETLSSDVEVSWSDYKSSELTAESGFRQKYDYDLARLLENVTRQTGLTFTKERRTIDEWNLRIKP